jgi:hypothetical protein
VDELVGHRCVVKVYLAYRCDTTPWGKGFLAGNTEGGTVRQAQATPHAGGEFLVVDVELHSVLNVAVIAASIGVRRDHRPST